MIDISASFSAHLASVSISILLMFVLSAVRVLVNLAASTIFFASCISPSLKTRSCDDAKLNFDGSVASAFVERDMVVEISSLDQFSSHTSTSETEYESKDILSPFEAKPIDGGE